MMLLPALVPTRSPHATHIHISDIVYKFVKGTTITAVDPEIDSHANIFGTSDESDTFQDNRLKKNHLLGVTLPRSYDVKIHCED